MIVALYTDGGVIGRNPSVIGGTWAFCAVDESGERVMRQSGVVPATPTRKITNNHTEQIAIVKALEAMPPGWSGKLYTDSWVALVRVFRNGKTRNLPANIIKRTIIARGRLGRIEPILIAGHPTKADLIAGVKGKLPVSHHNKWCDDRCRTEAQNFKT